MSMFRPLPRKQPKRPPIRTEVMNRGSISYSRGIAAEAPLHVQQLPFGWLLRLAGPLLGIKVVQTVSAVTGRSGTTPGTGTVRDVTFDGTAIGYGTETRGVLNISARSVGGGAHGFTIRALGYEWLGPIECS